MVQDLRSEDYKSLVLFGNNNSCSETFVVGLG